MSNKRKRERRTRNRNIALTVLGIIAGVTIVLGVTVAAVAYAYASSALKGLPNIDDPNAFKVAQPTKIYSADGKILANFFLENREIVDASKMATGLQDAVVAVEDERFYKHNGVDFVGILRAIVIDVSTGTMQEGASTITQQYMRNTILAKERYEISFNRKIREAFLAMEYEKRHSKREVLQNYLNTVYFGDGAYGAEAAAKNFFGKHANELTLAQSAMLAGLPQSPIRLNPYANMSGAKARQRWVLSRMVATGYITQAQADAASREKLVLNNSVDPNQGIYDCGYFVSYVRKQLLQQYSDSLVFEGGLKVFTTIDTRLQRAAEKAVKKTLPYKKDPDAALVSIDPRNGHIVAMYGGRNYAKDHYNTATQGRRQAGSSFKMFVLVTALEAGIPPRRQIDSSSPARIPTKPVWIVNNSEGSGHGYMSISAATRNSVNCVFARLIWELGADEVASTAKKMGITSKIPAFPSIALGTAPVSPLEMASAYGTLANRGVHVDPTAVTKILAADGSVLYDHEPNTKKSVSQAIAWATTQQLMGVVRGGTGTRAALPGREVAGKTGTAQNYQDAWFVGYTPQLVTAVWMGYSEGSIPMYSVHGMRAFGGTFCAPIWHTFMQAALKGEPKLKFARAKSPKYTWKKEWDVVPTSTVEPTKTPSGGGNNGGGSNGGGSNGGGNNGGGSNGGGNNGGGNNGGGGTTTTPGGTGTTGP